MKVLLLQDVYNLGRAGDIKKVANGFGRNYLIPQGLALLATPGSLKQSDRIREQANKKRTILNEEMASVAEQLIDVQLLFPAKAGETGKLYGSITSKMIAESLSDTIKLEISKRQIDSQPLRLLGMHTIKVRLTMDLIPEITAVIHREGESPENYMFSALEMAAEAEAEAAAQKIEDAKTASDTQNAEGAAVQTEVEEQVDEA
ncbi:MAG: 50S ribosomal protein L9 [Chloroflexi bacterium]|nr:50S ribosomal protein L9 [Chloroflexota bacterium]